MSNFCARRCLPSVDERGWAAQGERDLHCCPWQQPAMAARVWQGSQQLVWDTAMRAASTEAGESTELRMQEA
jgi:hypothetical protein